MTNKGTSMQIIVHVCDKTLVATNDSVHGEAERQGM